MSNAANVNGEMTNLVFWAMTTADKASFFVYTKRKRVIDDSLL